MWQQVNRGSAGREKRNSRCRDGKNSELSWAHSPFRTKRKWTPSPFGEMLRWSVFGSLAMILLALQQQQKYEHRRAYGISYTLLRSQGGTQNRKLYSAHYGFNQKQFKNRIIVMHIKSPADESAYYLNRCSYIRVILPAIIKS